MCFDRMTGVERGAAKILADFSRKVIREMWEGGEVDGGWIQDTAVEIGVLVPVEMAEPCGALCSCAEYQGEDGFPITCFRFPKWLDQLAGEVDAERH